MKIEVVKLNELQDFFYSERIQKHAHLPITSLRVSSQINNPNAKNNDVVLVVAFNMKDEIIAYFGCLPAKISNDKNGRFCFSSGWWKDEKKGNLAALKVFLKALQLWNMRMLFDELPEKSKTILSKSGNFEMKNIAGKKYFLQFDFANWIIKKIPGFSFAKTVFVGLDWFLNTFLSLIIYKKDDKSLQIKEIKFFDEECIQFVKEHSKNDFLNQSNEVFNWILKYPWLSNNKAKYKEENSKYHFSLLCHVFENKVFKVYQNKALITILFFTNRDGLYKLPYLYYKDDHIEEVAKAIETVLYQNNAKSFLTYQKSIINILSLKSIHSKNQVKTFAFPLTLKDRFMRNNNIQDGDGDVVFT